MAIITFFRVPKHKIFNYKPRYYNEKKEQLEARIRAAKAEAGLGHGDVTEVRTLKRGSFREKMKRNRKYEKKSNLRLVLIFLALLLLFYFILFR